MSPGPMATCVDQGLLCVVTHAMSVNVPSGEEDWSYFAPQLVKVASEVQSREAAWSSL